LFEVTQADVSLMAPDTATPSDTIDVAWVGPNCENDYVAIGRPGERSYENYTYVKASNPVELVMPSEVGTYDPRYILSQGSTVIATRAIEITPLQPQRSAPETS
jgi:Ca-activated chloride channel family protein